MPEFNWPQNVFLNELKTKFRAYVGGFGSGKTYVGCSDLLLFASRNPKVPQGYFAPTYRDIRDTFYPTFEETAFNFGFNCKIKKGDKEIEIYRGKTYYGVVICRSMDTPSSIVGFKIARALVDEIDTLAKDKALAAWRKIIARLRYVIPGVENGIGVTTTPEGFLFVYDTFANNPTESYSMVQASSYENQEYLPGDYIPSLIETYPEELVSAYIKGLFVNLKSGVVYKRYNRIVCRSTETIQDNEPLYIGQDFNVGDMWSCIYVQRSTGWHAVGQLIGIYDTPALIATIKEKYPNRSITIYPDASGASRKTVNASTSDIALLQQAGFSVRVNKSNPFVKDRILSVNTAFSKQKLWVNDTTAPKIADSLEKQSYDKNGEPDKSAGFDHGCDAFGYPIAFEMPINKPVLVTNIRMGR
jgi:hypothetical protein